ncbi:MAG: glycerol kinase GlpK [Bacteroidales bacterium]|nr:glycerol kinase GlpK [Bacteroidales bacterium]
MLMKAKYILALDQGTTSSRAILFDYRGQIVSMARKEFSQIYPRAGWVEHDPMEIWSSQMSVISELRARAGISAREIMALGITNQRETAVIWDRHTGKPVYNAIVWQDRRTADICDKLIEDGLEKMIRDRTGLIPDAYFSATKIQWMMDNIPGLKQKAMNGDLCFGTVDSWLLWKLTGGPGKGVHATDVSNASRTMLYNIKTLEWDNELLKLFGIPHQLMPGVRTCSEVYGMTDSQVAGFNVPVAGIAGDQQASLFGQLCVDEGMVKNTYGTGCFMILNTGISPVMSNNKLLTTIAWQIGDELMYGLEGSVFIAGAAVQWLRDGLEIIRDAPSSETLALSVEDNGGVYFVPALSGLGAPWWDPRARGTITGITRGTTKAHIARAAIESIAFQVRDVLMAMESDFGRGFSEIRADGGASANNLLLQFQSDILNADVIRPSVLETTALGAAYLAGLAIGFWDSVDELKKHWSPDRLFSPSMDKEKVTAHLYNWKQALEKTMSTER